MGFPFQIGCYLWVVFEKEYTAIGVPECPCFALLLFFQVVMLLEAAAMRGGGEKSAVFSHRGMSGF